MTLKLNFFAKSDRGLIRDNNEDSGYAGPHLLILADGMGGHAAGEVASELMVNHLEILDQDPGQEDTKALLEAAADQANEAISDHVKAHPETEGMGTTLSTMLFNGTDFGVCHVGDSRGYLLRDGKLEQITKDDTYVQSLVDKGELDPGDVSSHPQKSLILKAYTGRPVEATLFTLEAKPGDRILLCSDGLSDPVTASTIETALGLSRKPQVIPPAVMADGEEERPEPADEEAEEETSGRKTGWKVLLALLIVLALVIGAGLWAKNFLSNNYYVATNEAQEITIQQGADYSVFGKELHSTNQYVCINDSNSLLFSGEPCKGDFAPLKVTDLPESERSAVDHLSTGDLGEVQQQVNVLLRRAKKIRRMPRKTSLASPAGRCRL